MSTISSLLITNARLKSNVFPLPVPTSRMASRPSKTVVAVAICQLPVKGSHPKACLANEAIAVLFTSPGLYYFIVFVKRFETLA